MCIQKLNRVKDQGILTVDRVRPSNIKSVGEVFQIESVIVIVYGVTPDTSSTLPGIPQRIPCQVGSGCHCWPYG